MRIKRALIALGLTGLTLSVTPDKGQASGPPITPALVAYTSATATFTWGLPLPTSGYIVQASTFGAFGFSPLSSYIYDENVSTLTISGLNPNSFYLFRVGALYAGATQYAVTSPSTTITLTQPLVGAAILQTTASSIKARWGILGASSGYLLQISTDSLFGSIIASSGTNNVNFTTMTINGLASDTTYYVRAGALNSQSVPNYVVIGSTLTSSGGAGANIPTGLAGFALGQSSIAWTWNAVSSATSYGVYVTTEPGTAIALGIGTTGFIETGLDINSQYSRSVTAVVSSSESAPSSGVALYTLAVPPGVPSFTNIGQSSATINWSPAGNPAGTRYEVSQSSTPSFTTGVSTPIAFTQNFTAITTDFINLNFGTTYYFRVRAENGNTLVTAYSSINSFVTAVSTVPSPPAGLAGNALSASAINWTWGPVPGFSSFNLYMATSPTTVVTTGISTGAYTETGLSTNTAYSRVVTVIVSGSESGLSNSATTYTLAAQPGTPNFSNISTGSVTLTWATQGNPAGTKYSVSRSTSGGFSTAISTPITFGQNFTANTTNFANLALGTTYFFRVQAQNGNNIATAFGAINGMATLASTVTTPSGLAGNSLGVSSITWIWGTVSGATSYNLYMATSPTTVIASGLGTNNYSEIGLSTNTAYARVVTAVVASSESALSNSATAYTQAAVPGGPSYSFISNSSATLTWSANTNPAGTSYEVTRSSNPGFSGSTTMVSFGANFTGTTTAFFTLSPGTTYYFRTRARNGAFIPTAFSSITSLTTLGSGGGSSGSGTGSAAVLPTTIPEAGVVTATMTFTVPASGMSTNGKLEITLPSGWGTPLQTTTPGQPGYVAVTGGSFNIVPSSQGVVLLTLSSGFLTNGSIVTVTFQNLYTNCPTQTFPQAQWKVRSAMASTDAMGDVTAPAPETYTTGPLNSVNFVPWNVVTIGANQTSPALLLQTSDSCGQPVSLAAPLVITWTGLLPDQINTDASIQFSTNSFATTTNSFSIPASTSMAVFYIRSAVAGNNRWIRGNYTHPINGNPYQAWRQVNVLSQSFAFNSVSVDNGTPVNGQTSLTLTPDADGVNDNATIRFVPNDPNTTWHVAISSDGFQYSVFERWGSSNPLSSLLWDGRDQHTNYFVSNGSYSVKLEDVNGTAVNTSLLITLTTAKISGQITLGGVPVAGALVSAYGTGSTAAAYAAARTDTSGNYSVYGLHSGSTYNLYASFVSTTTQAQISGQISNVTATSTGRDFALANPGVLRVSAVSPAAAAVAVYGNLNIYNNSANYGGNIHLSAGSTASDNGDSFNPSTWTILGLAPSTYTLHLNMQGYAAADQVVTVTAGVTTDVTLTLTSRANVYGQITLPSAAGASIWVPVQGTPQGSNFPTVYGGAFFNVGQQNAIYSLFAVAPGTYTFTAQPPGLIPEKQTNVTVGSADIGNSSTGGLDFSGFGTGGEINGVIALHGNTTSLPNPFTIWLNAFSPQLGQNAFTQVQLVPDANNTAAGYILSGLADGVYQLNPPYMSGFSTPGMANVVVNSGVPTTLNIDLYENTGRITGAVHLPNGNVDYANVHISLQGPINQEKDLTGSTYSLDQLDTGFYRLIASYLTTGAQVRMNVPVTNGTAPQNIPIDLAISTYSVSGTVSVQSGFTMTDSSGAAVTITTIQNLLDAATQQTLILGGAQTYSGTSAACAGGIATVVTTARVEAFPKDFDSYNQANRNGIANCFGVNQYKYGTIALDGSYSISGLTPGIWEIDVYPYFDGGSNPNVAVEKKIVSILSGNVTGKDFTLAGGNAVAGTISLPDGLTDVRSFNLQVQTDRGDPVQSIALDIGLAGSPAASATYAFSHLANGNYSLVLRDQGTFDSTLNRNVIRYVAKPVQFQITGGDLSTVNMTLALASRIVGKLAIQGANPDGTSALTLITPNNSNLLSTNFSIQAQANPWVPSGYAQANFSTNGPGIEINSDNQFTIDGMIAGTYDVYFRQFSYGATTLGSLDLAAYTQGGVVVPQGQTLDLGTITLQPGLAVSGLVTDSSGHALPNIRVRANPSNSQHGNDGQEVFTNSDGKFAFTGLNPKVKIYDFIAAPRPSPNDTVQPVPYGQLIKRTVDVTPVPAPNLTFALPTAVAGFSGTVATVDGGAFSFPSGGQSGYPAAAIYVNLQGNAAANDPLGDENATALDGTFTISNLPAGIYDLTIESLGYRPVKMTGLTLTNAIRALGTITLQKGPALTATLAKPDGSAVNTTDVHQAVAASADLSSIIFGQINSDAQTGNILSIKFAGFELAPKTYSILLFDTHDNIIVPQEGRNLQFTTNTDSLAKAITFQPTAPQALVSIQKSTATADVYLTFYFSRPIRNGVSDTDPSAWVTRTSGSGTLSNVILSGDRRQLFVTYTPALNEQNAAIQFSAHTVDIDPSTGVEYVLAKSVTLLLGQIATAEQSINPAIGGNMSLSDALDTTQVAIPANALLNTNGTAADATASYAFTLSATDDASTAGASALSHAPRVAGMMRRGAGAYLSEAYDAMQAARAQATINPLSSFYSILLPAGISHSLNQTATLTLNYDTTADPNQINVYFYNGSQYIIETALRRVDTVNHTISVGVSHFSTFVVLENSQPVIQVNGGASSTADITVYNFPNPFNLESKNLTDRSGAPIPAGATIIHLTIPAAKLGPASIDIFNVVGEKVRTITLAPAGDTHIYVPWDGRNDSGKQVASGVYIGMLKVGSEKKFFKMAVIK